MRATILKAVPFVLVMSLITTSSPAQKPAQKPATQQTKVRSLPLGLPEAKVRKHVIAPAHVKNVEMEEVNEAREVKYRFPSLNKKFKLTPKLNVQAFGTAVHTILKDNVTGYVLQIRQNGTVIYNLVWNWAQTPANEKKGWNENTSMHVASVSKFLTAVGLVKALDSHGISYDAKIIDYLPTYWTNGNNVDKITFRHLMTHKSGFDSGEGGDKYRTDYAFMKLKVAAGVTSPGTSSGYENMNFGLCRILIPIINGDINRKSDFINDAALNDQAWDAVTLYHYKNYMQAKVFTQAGVGNASFEPGPGGKNALAYKFPHNNVPGWNSGDLATVAGGAGWRLSAGGLLSVMNHVRRRNTIIPAQKAQYMLDNKFGIDQVTDSAAGKLYNKNGAWRKGGRTEQCVAYFLPEGMELVVFVNSPIGTDGFSLRGIVKDAFINSLSN